MNDDKNIYDYLENKYTEYLLAHRKIDKEKIERDVRDFARYNIPDETYIKLSDGHASGLFEPGFFESDLGRSVQTLREKLNEEKDKA